MAELTKRRAGKEDGGNGIEVKRCWEGQTVIRIGEKTKCASCRSLFVVKYHHQVVCDRCQLEVAARKRTQRQIDIGAPRGVVCGGGGRVKYRADQHRVFVPREKLVSEKLKVYLPLSEQDQALVNRLSHTQQRRRRSEDSAEAPGAEDIIRGLQLSSRGPSSFSLSLSKELSARAFGRPALHRQSSKTTWFTVVLMLRYATLLGTLADYEQSAPIQKSERINIYQRLSTTKHTAASALRALHRIRRRYLRRCYFFRFVASASGQKRAFIVQQRTLARTKSKPLLSFYRAPTLRYHPMTTPKSHSSINEKAPSRRHQKHSLGLTSDSHHKKLEQTTVALDKENKDDSIRLGRDNNNRILLGSRSRTAPILHAPPSTVFGRAKRPCSSHSSTTKKNSAGTDITTAAEQMRK